jgi:hypothetical protein
MDSVDGAASVASHHGETCGRRPVEEAAFGRYRLLALIGEGAMGKVYKALNTMIGRDVAIKVLPTELGAELGYRERFRREAHTAARLGPSVPSLIESGWRRPPRPRPQRVCAKDQQHTVSSRPKDANWIDPEDEPDAMVPRHAETIAGQLKSVRSLIQGAGRPARGPTRRPGHRLGYGGKGGPDPASYRCDEHAPQTCPLLSGANVLDGQADYLHLIVV